MNLAVKMAGGEVLDEVLPANPGFENADYLFRSDHVVAELKRFEHTGINNEKIIEKGSALFRRFQEKWREEGRRDVPIAYGRVRIPVHEFPHEFGFEFTGLLKDAFQGLMRKANRQIRATKGHFNIPLARGLLLLCIDGDSGMTLEVVLHVVDRLLRGNHFTSINSIVVFSVNFAFALPGLHAVRPLLLASKEDRPSVPNHFVQRLAEAWNARITVIGGPPLLLLGSGVPPEQLEPLLRLKLQPTGR